MLSDSLDMPARPISADLASSVGGLPLVAVEWKAGVIRNGFQRLRGSPTDWDDCECMLMVGWLINDSDPDLIVVAFNAKQSGNHTATMIRRADIVSVRTLPPLDLGKPADPA